MKTKIVIFSLFLSINMDISTSLAQNYWDINFNGAKVKEEILKSYTINEAGEKGEIQSSTNTTFYADGKKNQVLTSYYYDGNLYSTNKSTYVYNGDSLIQIYNKYNQCHPEYGCDSSSSIDVIIKSQNHIQPIETHGYDDIYEFYGGGIPNSKMINKYNSNNKVSYHHTFKKGKYEFEENRAYKKDQLISIVQKMLDIPNGETTESLIEFKVIESDKYGWLSAKVISKEQTGLEERQLVLYTKEAIEDTANLYKKPSPLYTLEGVFEKLNQGQQHKDSVSDQQYEYIKLAIELLEENTKKPKEEINYYLIQAYELKVKYHYGRKQIEQAIEAANVALKYTSTENKENEYKFYTILSYLHEKQAGYVSALSYYEKYFANSIAGDYDPLGNYKTVRLANLYLLNGEKQKAMEVIDKDIKKIDGKLKSDTDIASNNSDVYNSISFFGLVESVAEFLENSGDYKKAELYLSKTGEFYESTLGKDDIEYKKNQENLVRVKKYN